jgi:hypothetical protein
MQADQAAGAQKSTVDYVQLLLREDPKKSEGSALQIVLREAKRIFGRPAGRQAKTASTRRGAGRRPARRQTRSQGLASNSVSRASPSARLIFRADVARKRWPNDDEFGAGVGSRDSNPTNGAGPVDSGFRSVATGLVGDDASPPVVFAHSAYPTRHFRCRSSFTAPPKSWLEARDLVGLDNHLEHA